MDRRDFIAVTATTSATLASLASSAHAGAPPELVAAMAVPPVADMDEYVARVDAGLSRIGLWSVTAELKEFPGDRKATDRLVQVSMQSLFMTGMLGDLPLPQQLDPRMQERVERALPLFDEAADGMTAFLKSRTEMDLHEASANLRRPGVSDAIIDGLVLEAGRTGVSAPRRGQLREMLKQMSWRLAHQPPALVVDEYLEKVARAAESDLETESRQRAIAARVGEEFFWEQGGKTPRQRRHDRGARLLGIGAVVFAVSGGLVAAGAYPAVFGMTVGAVQMIIGLLMLLSAATMPKTPADSAATRR